MVDDRINSQAKNEPQEETPAAYYVISDLRKLIDLGARDMLSGKESIFVLIKKHPAYTESRIIFLCVPCVDAF